MKAVELRVGCLLAVLAVIACGSSAPTDFHSVDQGTQNGGNAGAQPGGNGGAGLGGNAGALLGGSAGIASGGSGGSGEAGAGAGGGLAGSAGSVQGGAAGLAGTPAVGGTTAGAGSSSGGSTGGSATVPYACGTLTCIQGRQMCVHTLPAMSAGTHMYQCLEYPDSCATVDCSCFCKGPMNNPCGSGSACMCSGDAGRITVQCTES